MNRFVSIGLTAAITLLIFAGSASAQIRVLSARGPSASGFPPGSIIPAKRVLTLKDGDSLDVIDGAVMRTIKGPGNIAAGKVSQQQADMLTQIFNRSNQRRPGIAAVRGVSQARTPPGLWHLNVSASGSFCVPDGQTPTLWRDGSGAEAQVEIVQLSTGVASKLAWPGDTSSLAWPTALPFRDQDQYQILLETDDPPRAQVVFRRIAPRSPSLTDLAAELADKQCFAQLDTLRASLEDRAQP